MEACTSYGQLYSRIAITCGSVTVLYTVPALIFATIMISMVPIAAAPKTTTWIYCEYLYSYSYNGYRVTRSRWKLIDVYE